MECLGHCLAFNDPFWNQLDQIWSQLSNGITIQPPIWPVDSPLPTTWSTATSNRACAFLGNLNWESSPRSCWVCFLTAKPPDMQCPSKGLKILHTQITEFQRHLNPLPRHKTVEGSLCFYATWKFIVQKIFWSGFDIGKAKNYCYNSSWWKFDVFFMIKAHCILEYKLVRV
jgi:hypothetical protein